MNFWLGSVLFFFLLKLGLVHAGTRVDEENLHAFLFPGYDKEIRPGMNRSIPLQVDIIFYLYSINDFDLNKGKLSITGVFLLKWIDERLSWNPATFNDTNGLSISHKKVWIPNLVNVNPYDDVTQLRTDASAVRVWNNGVSVWFALQTFEVICKADVTKYPFDTQTCAIRFYFWGYNPEEIKSNCLPPGSDEFAYYSKNGIWNIIDSSSYVQLDFHKNEIINIEFKLERRAPYYIVSLILPIASVSFLIGFVFLLPVESGERVGFSTTSLLSVIVYLTIIQEMLPESSEPNISTLGYMLVTYVVTGSFVVIEVIISLWIQSRPSQSPIPQSLGRLMTCILKKRNKISVDTLDTKQEECDIIIDDVTWPDLLRIYDKACFIFTNIVFCVSSLIYFCIVLS